MRYTLLGLIIGLLIVVPSVAMSSTKDTANSTADCVILLHGLARTSASMNAMQLALIEAGFLVAKIDYPSREKTIETLAAPAVEQGLSECASQTSGSVHVVTHSMGGILFRQYIDKNGAEKFLRTVMLGPPNKGSEAVDALRDIPGFKWLNGPAGLQLGTDENSVPRKLGAATSDVAIIAGTFSINVILSTYLPDPDDGKVSVASSKLEGMCAHLQMDVSHPFLMKNDDIIDEVINYLNHGKFISQRAQYPECLYRTSE